MGLLMNMLSLNMSSDWTGKVRTFSEPYFCYIRAPVWSHQKAHSVVAVLMDE